MRKKLSYKEWIEKAKELYGDNLDDWEFKCPSCGHIQSIKSVLEHNPSLIREKIQNLIYYKIIKGDII